MNLTYYKQNALCVKSALIKLAKTHGLTLLLAIAFLLTITHRYQLALNMTESLPQTLFLIDKEDHALARNDYFAFRWTQGGPIPNGIIVVKQIKGVTGDVIGQRIIDKNAYITINDEPVAKLKARARNGDVLVPIRPTQLTRGEFFAYAPHPDSLDSRYALTGVIKASQIVGRAYPLF